MTDLAVVDAVMHALSGDLRKLADLIEKGVPLDETARGIVAAHLRGNFKPDRRRRSYAARMADSTVLFTVEWLARLEIEAAKQARAAGRRRRPTGGETLYLQSRPHMSENTLKQILKRARRDRRASPRPRWVG